MSAQSGKCESSDVCDVVGVGFGPANLALAIAIHEHNEKLTHPAARLKAMFVEGQPRFGWHRGMLLEGTTMQVSFLKDLATMRNPATEFSFLNYLKAKNRLIDFINRKQFFPSRIEFHDYLEWAATSFSSSVLYGARVDAVRLIESASGMRTHDAFEVTAECESGVDPSRRVIVARNVVLGLGLEPSLPAGTRLSANVIHTQDLLRMARELPQGMRGRFIVVGAGQSAAEATQYLHRRFANAEICAVFSRFGYSPSDDSPFANRIFDPQSVDELYHARPEVREKLAAYHRNTNYSVVDIELIQELYDISYQELVTRHARLKLHRASCIATYCETDRGLTVSIRNLSTGSETSLEADKLIFATGYCPRSPLSLLGDLDKRCRKDEAGRYVVHRDYRLELDGAPLAGLYLQGNTEHSHGITSSLLSNLPIRTEEILQSILARRAPTLDFVHPPVSVRAEEGARHAAS